MADLFISHSSVDVAWTRELRRQLEAAGYTCWMAPDDMAGSTPWAEQILKAIEDCRVLIVVISHAANASSHVSKEVGAALEYNKPLLPIRVEDVSPTGSLNYLLQLVQWVDAFPGGIADHAERIRRAVAYSIPGASGGPVTSSTQPPANVVAGQQIAGAAPSLVTSPLSAPLSAPPSEAAPTPEAAVAPSGTIAPPVVAPPPSTPVPPAYIAPPPAGWQPRAQGPGGIATGRMVNAAAIIGGIAIVALAVVGVAAVGGAFRGPSAPPATSRPSGILQTTPGPTLQPSGTSTREPTPEPTVAPTSGPTVLPTNQPSHTPVPTPPITHAPSEAPIADLAALLPLTVDTLVLAAENTSGDVVFGSDASAAAMRGFLASVGKAPADLKLARALDAAGGSALELYGFYLEGIDPVQLQQALVATAFTSASNSQTAHLTLGGKPVLRITSSSSAPIYVYTERGAVWAVVSADEALADRAIAATPVS